MSIWQTLEWQEMLKISGQTEAFFELEGLFIEKRKIGLGNYGLFIMGCFFSEISNELLSKLIDLTVREKAIFCQIENNDYFLNDKINFKLKNGYYKKFITPYTAIIDLNLSEEDILLKMKQKGRYNIRLAEKKGVIIKESEKSTDNIKIFYDLMQETTIRDSFSGNSISYYKDFLIMLKESKLLFAYYNGIVIAAGIFVYYKGIAIYYYGASTSNKEYRSLMAPYLLQWEAIRIGKNIGCGIYDFLGISTPGENNSKLKGVSDFKLKLTSNTLKVSDSYIYINKKMKFFLLQLLRRLKSF